MVIRIERKPNESSIDFHRRIIYGKVRDKTIDEDYAELSEALYGKPYSADATRKMAYGSFKTLQLLDEGRREAADPGILAELDQREIEVRKLTQRFYDQRAAYNKLLRDQARADELRSLIERAIKEGNLPELPAGDVEGFVSDLPGRGETDLIVCLSDIHYGIQVCNHWTTFDSDVCAQMMARYLGKIREIAYIHGSKRCYVAGLGDFVSGIIHLPIALQNKENLVQQIMGVSELIAQFVNQLTVWFPEVRFISVSGNHSRVAKKEDARADERLDDLIGFYLKARFAEKPNVFIEEDAGNKLDSTMASISVRGNNYVLVHGDFDNSAAGIQSLCAMVGKPVYGVLCGHKHHSYSETIQGVRVVMSGSFVATDDYAVSKRLYSIPEQTVLVCDDNGIVCQYNVPLWYGK